MTDPADGFMVGDASYSTLQAAFDAVQDGGSVIVKGGFVFNDQAGVLSKNNVTVTTDSGTARFRKKAVNAKGCFQIKGNNTAVRNIEFESVHTPVATNGAGIRLEGKGLTLSNCKFIGCDDGILTSNASAPYVGGPGTVTIDHCLFDSCGYGDGQSHGIYIGYGLDSILTLTNSAFQYTYVGHLVKSRAYRTAVDSCLFIKGTASRAIDASNGGHVTVTNSLFYQDPQNNNPQFIAMGGDLAGEPLFPDNSFMFDASNKVLDTNSVPKPINTVYNNLVVEPNIGSAWPGNSAPPLPPRYAADGLPQSFTTWASIPVGRWVEIAGSRMDRLQPAPDPSVMSLWRGAAFDDASGKFYVAGSAGAGFVASGQYEFDAESFTWRVGIPPQGGVNSALAENTFGGLCFVPGKGVVMLLSDSGPALYDPAAGTASYISAVPIGSSSGPAKFYSHSYWDAPSGRAYLMAKAGSSSYGLFPYDPFTDKRYPDAGGSALYLWYGSQSTPIHGTRKIFFWNQLQCAAWMIDLSTDPPTPLAVPPLHEPEGPLTYNATGLFGTDHAMAICHCPGVGVIALCASGRTAVINPDTGAVSTLNVEGTAISRATLAKAGIVNGTWGRFRYYPARNALILLASTDENVKVLRLGRHRPR